MRRLSGSLDQQEHHQHGDDQGDLQLQLDEMRRAIALAGKRASKRELPLHLRRPQSANELGGTRSIQAPQLLSTKHSAPAYSFGGSSADRLKVVLATSPGPMYAVRSTLGTSSISFGTAEQRPRPQDQRKFSHHSTTPGPASYALPSSIGASHVLSRMHSARASSFGTAPARSNAFARSASTSSARYSLPSGVTREGKRAALGSTWSNAPRYADSAELANAPGPASYSRPSSIGRGNIESTLRNEPAVGFGTASRANSDFTALALKHSRNYPGAGAYNHPSQLGPQLLSEKRSARGMPFARADRFKRLAVDESFVEGCGYASEGQLVSPGPGDYVV